MCVYMYSVHASSFGFDRLRDRRIHELCTEYQLPSNCRWNQDNKTATLILSKAIEIGANCFSHTIIQMTNELFHSWFGARNWPRFYFCYPLIRWVGSALILCAFHSDTFHTQVCYWFFNAVRETWSKLKADCVKW